MSLFALWLTRISHILAIAAHVAGALLIHYRDGALGPVLVASAWGGLILYSAIFYIRGDFIQRALNAKPWADRDELQVDGSRRAMARGYIVGALAMSMVIGLNLDAVWFEPPETLEEVRRALHVIFLQLATGAFVTVAAPTLYMAFAMKPLRDEEAVET